MEMERGMEGFVTKNIFVKNNNTYMEVEGGHFLFLEIRSALILILQICILILHDTFLNYTKFNCMKGGVVGK
jgi:hypothetical protein